MYKMTVAQLKKFEQTHAKQKGKTMLTKSDKDEMEEFAQGFRKMIREEIKIALQEVTQEGTTAQKDINGVAPSNGNLTEKSWENRFLSDEESFA